MKLLLHVLQYKFLSFLKTTFEAKWVSVVRGFGSLAVFGGFAAGAFLMSLGATRFLLNTVQVGLYVFHLLLSMVFFTLFIAINLGNIIVSYSTLYRSAEVTHLLTKPVPYTTIFVMKFLDNFLYSSTTLFLVAFAAMLGYGTYFGYPWFFYIGSMIFLLVPLMFLAACIAVLVLFAIMKLASKIGFRQVMVYLFGLYFAFTFLFFRFLNPVRLIEYVNRVGPEMTERLRFFEPKFLAYLPSHWASSSLYFFAKGDTGQGILSAGVLLYAAVIAFGIVLFVGHRYYYRSWLVSLQVTARTNDPAILGRIRLFDFRKPSLLPSQMEVLLKKEYFSFFREPSQWIHLLVMIVLTAIFALSVGNMNLRLRVTEIQLITYLVLFSFAGFLSCSIALRFLFPMASLEGKAFWLLRSGPIKTSHVMLLKLGLGTILVFLMAVAVAVAMNFPFLQFAGRRPLLMWFGLYQAFWFSLAVSSMNLGFGAYFANYAEKNPIRLASTQGATLTFLTTLVMLFVVVSLVILPLNSYFQTLFTFKKFEMDQIVVPGTMLAVVSMLLAVFGVHIGLRAVRRDF